MTDLAVVVRGMRLGYGQFVVLDEVDLTVAEGEIVAVTGVNGAGKSTLLSCLAGLHRQLAGTLASRRPGGRGSSPTPRRCSSR